KLLRVPSGIVDYGVPQDIINGIVGLAVGPDGEVYALGSGGAVYGGGFQTTLTRLVDAQGKYGPAPVGGLALGGKEYVATLADSPEKRPVSGAVTVGRTRIPLRARSGSLEDAHVLGIEPDGSFYARVGERL